MNAIMGFSGLLAENYDDKPTLEKYSGIINNSCSNLLEIINDILDISKIESGQLDINNEECDIIELFDELYAFFSEQQIRLDKQQIALNFKFDGDKSYAIVKTDKVKLKQILINLVGNAFKFTKNGSIECACSYKKNQLHFYVSDTGIGIPPDKHEFIFERFSQLHHQSLKNIGGTGLGLSIAKGLAGVLGGEMWLISEPEPKTLGKSIATTFHFTINYLKSDSMSDKLVTNSRDYEFFFSDKTILIVEDDAYNALYLKEILANTGLKIISAEYGKEAIQLTKQQAIDVVLMDVRLPDLNGYEATQIILQSKPNIKIIAQTAYAGHDERQKALDAGCVDYISKPTKRDSLLELISKYLAVDQ